MKSTISSWPALLRWCLPLIGYFMVGAVALGANPFHSKTITPFDVLVSQQAWAFVNPGAKVRDYQRSDILNSRLPQWEVAKRQLRQGHFPVWNDKIAGGGTFLTVNTDIFTPAFAIFAAVRDSATGFFWAMLVNLIIAGLGMHVFLRRHLSMLPAAIGGISFELCGFIAAWLYWPHVFVIIWVPWLLAAVDACARRPGAGRCIAIALVSALICLGGFPFLSVLAMETAALYAVILWAFLWHRHQTPWRFASWYVAGTLFGLLLAAPPLFGLIHWLSQFDIGYRYGRGSYLDIHDVKQLLPPWAYQVQRVEKTMYVGLAMTVAAAITLGVLLTRWRRATTLPVFAIALLIITAGLVFGLWPMWLIGWLPGMAFNSWSRAIGLLEIALIIIGAFGLDRFCASGDARWIWPRRGVIALVAIAQLVEMVNFDRSYNGPVPDSYYFPDTPSITYMKNHVGPFDYAITDKSFVMSGTLGVYGLREWLAHYFRTPALQAALHRMADHPFNSHRASASRFVASDIKYDSPTMAAYNVRFAAIDSRKQPPKGRDKHFHRVFEASGTAIYENDRSPDGPYFLSKISQMPNADSGKDVTVESYRPNHFTLRYRGVRPGLVVVPMSINTDWQITVDGKPAGHELKDGVLPAVRVMPGSIMRFVYRPAFARYVWPWLAVILGFLTTIILVGRHKQGKQVRAK